MKTKAEELHTNSEAIDLSTALLINGKSLEQQPVKHSNPVERKFKSEKEFTELVVDNNKVLFDKDTMLIDATQSPLKCYVLLDYRDAEKHRLCFVDITLSKENFWELFIRITSLFTLVSQPDYPINLVEVLMGVISENKPLKKELNLLVGEDIGEYFGSILLNKPFVLLLTDQERQELEEIMMTYASNWGKLVKPILIRKYADNNELFCTMSPTFMDIDFNSSGKIVKDKREQKQKLTEADHLENSSDVVKAIYQTIKIDLLKVDASIEFNPKQYYISMRKGKNLAFFHIKKKLISLVVMHSETETRKLIKHHDIKTLTEKVQEFWNGASCSIVIDSLEGLDEVIVLLKKLIQ